MLKDIGRVNIFLNVFLKGSEGYQNIYFHKTKPLRVFVFILRKPLSFLPTTLVDIASNGQMLTVLVLTTSVITSIVMIQD